MYVANELQVAAAVTAAYQQHQRITHFPDSLDIPQQLGRLMF